MYDMEQDLYILQKLATGRQKNERRQLRYCRPTTLDLVLRHG